MKIEIYACRFGAGHMKAAEFLQSQLSEYETEIFDVPKEVFPGVASLIYRVYGNMMKSQSLLLQCFLSLDRNKDKIVPRLDFLEECFFKWMDKKTLPDVFIASYSMVAYLLSRYKEQRRLKIPLVTCLTDFSPHTMWINPKTDLYLVPSSFTADKLILAGVPRAKVLICGLGEGNPVVEKKQSRYLRILVSGGGLGLIPKEKNFYRDLKTCYGGEIRVICGRNKRLYHRLKNARIPGIQVYGFVNNMPEHLAWADVIVGKAGGLSTFEAIQSETPILYTAPFLPQEERNAEFICQNKIGAPLWSPFSFTEYDEEKEKNLNLLRENMKQIKEELRPEDLKTWIEQVA